MQKTLYEILGVKPDFTEEQLKKAHRKKVKKHHPDVGGDTENFTKIQEAYEILSNPERRRVYDLTGQVPHIEPNKDVEEAVELLSSKFRTKLDSLSNKELLCKGITIGISVSLNEDIKTQEKAITYEKERIQLLTILGKRMKVKKRKQINVAREVIEQQIEYSRAGIENCKHRIKIIKKALVFLGHLYVEIEVDPITGIIVQHDDVDEYGIIKSKEIPVIDNLGHKREYVIVTDKIS